MNCHYCQRKCRSVSDKLIASTGGSIHLITKLNYPLNLSSYASKGWRCDYHGAISVICYNIPEGITDEIYLDNIITNTGPDDQVIVLKYLHHDSTYCIQLYRSQIPELNKFHVLKIQSKNKIEKLLELSFLPNITPENIKTKLPTILTFL